MKTVINEGSFCIRHHNNERFLNCQRQFVPLNVVQMIEALKAFFRCELSTVAINEQIYESETCNIYHDYDIRINFFPFLRWAKENKVIIDIE